MYITITAQKLGSSYAKSAQDFVTYLEKENEGKSIDDMEHFFNQHGEEIPSAEVIQNIDGNTSKLKKTEPKFYSITLNPSKYELQQLQQHSKDLRSYTREVMKAYAKSFNREIDGRAVSVDDIKYYAKIEHQRTYKGTDKVIQENAPYQAKIARLKNEIRQVERGELKGNINKKQKQIKRLKKEAPYQLHGEMIVQGMAKEGAQSHVHIIVSRKDMSNRYSLSPGSKYKASEVKMNGKVVKRGFDRDQFYAVSEEKFDKQFNYQRNYVESYEARKTLIKNPERYFSSIMGLPTNQRTVAFKLLGKADLNTSIITLPTNQVQLVLKTFKKLKRGVDKALQSGSIGI